MQLLEVDLVETLGRIWWCCWFHVIYEWRANLSFCNPFHFEVLERLIIRLLVDLQKTVAAPVNVRILLMCYWCEHEIYTGSWPTALRWPCSSPDLRSLIAMPLRFLRTHMFQTCWGNDLSSKRSVGPAHMVATWKQSVRMEPVVGTAHMITLRSHGTRCVKDNEDDDVAADDDNNDEDEDEDGGSFSVIALGNRKYRFLLENPQEVPSGSKSQENYGFKTPIKNQWPLHYRPWPSVSSMLSLKFFFYRRAVGIATIQLDRGLHCLAFGHIFAECFRVPFRTASSPRHGDGNEASKNGNNIRQMAQVVHNSTSTILHLFLLEVDALLQSADWDRRRHGAHCNLLGGKLLVLLNSCHKICLDPICLNGIGFGMYGWIVIHFVH